MRIATLTTAAIATTGSAVLVEKGALSLPGTVGLLVLSGFFLGGGEEDSVGRGLIWAAGGLVVAAGIDHLLSRK